ncbi:MAG: penicillin-binding protein 2, partial [Actinomycetota bacterium]
DNKGLAGVEFGLDSLLAGTSGTESVVRDPFGRVLEVLETKPVKEGRDVYLTLDHTLQGQVERILGAARTQWSAKAATAIVMDPRTGAMLTMAVEPGFDANKFGELKEGRERNRAVTDTYEPGSTFKVVTLAGALESGMVTPSDRYTLRPEIQVADRVIHDAEPRGTETMTVSQILFQSSNVGVITLALGLGTEQLATWIDRFGFGHRTGIDFPGESRGIVLPPERWSGSTIGNVPIGQGIAVTPMQMAAAYATIANKGVEVQPHLVDRVEGEGARKVKRRRVLSAETATELTAMLRQVVGNDHGTGQEAQVPGYSIAGKTGTAAKPDPVLGGYSTSKYVASFVGFLPASNPRLVILVAIDEPKGAIWGGSVAAPVFSQIARFALQYLEVPPDAPQTAEQQTP